MMDDVLTALGELRATITAQAAEIARLREALNSIEDYALAFPDLETVVSMARDALEVKP